MTTIVSAAQLERIYERKMDKIDTLYLGGHIEKNEYDQMIQELNEWIDNMYESL